MPSTIVPPFSISSNSAIKTFCAAQPELAFETFRHMHAEIVKGWKHGPQTGSVHTDGSKKNILFLRPTLTIGLQLKAETDGA